MVDFHNDGPDLDHVEQELVRREGKILAIVSSSISLVSSILMMTIILRSQDKLSYPYHRIMFFICICDIISSTAIATTTLPMPADVDKVYDFPGNSYGNANTCSIQGFLIVTGECWTLGGTMLLATYYVSTLRYGMSERKVNRFFLPALFVVIGAALPMNVIPLCLGFINPRPYEIYCTIGPYPNDCNRSGNPTECIRGGKVDEKTEDMIFLYMTIALSMCMIIITTSLAFSVAEVFKNERMPIENPEIFQLEQEDAEIDQQILNESNSHHFSLSPAPSGSGESRGRIEKKELRETRSALGISLMYIAAFFITWIWTVISILPIPALKNMSQTFWDVINDLRHFFLPLQGFFNTLIFIYHKVHNIRKESSAEEITLTNAIIRVIKNPNLVPPRIIVSSLEIVKNDIDARETQQQRLEELESKRTPSLNLGRALCSTTGKENSPDKEEDAKDIFVPPSRQFYPNTTLRVEISDF